MSGIVHFPILVAIETDSTIYHGEEPHPPDLLDRGGAEQMLAHLAQDLAGMLPEIQECILCMPGALYDQTQILQPRYPVFAALESLVPTPESDGSYASRLLSIGVAEGRMPEATLQPDLEIPPGILQLLPILVSGQADSAAALFEQMEHVFMEKGQLSPHSAKGLEASFAVVTRHARFMTLTDLSALLHIQLDHFGFLPLWKLLDAALEQSSAPFEVEGRLGQRFHWRNGSVWCRFETFDYWASEGSGQAVSGDAGELISAYIDWTREYRQYLVTLAGHGVELSQHLPEQPGQALPGTFLVEASSQQTSGNPAQATEHTHPELGTLAVTVFDQGKQSNYYPLWASGLNDLHETIRDDGLAHDGVSFPGGMLCSPGERRLVPDTLD